MIGAADHHAIAALKPPHAAARAHVHIIYALGQEFVGAADVVDVVQELPPSMIVSPASSTGARSADRLVDDCRGHHEPESPGLFQLLHKICKGRAADRLLVDKLLDRLWRHVENDAFVAVSQEPPHHVGAHSPQSDHSKLHMRFLQTIERSNRLRLVLTLPLCATS